MSEERARRVGLNEALFRQVNEQIRSLTDTFGGPDDGMITVICECGDADCTERLELRLADYERVRSEGDLYVVAKGHVFPDVETVVEAAEVYEVVRKNEGVPQDLANETDPRS